MVALHIQHTLQDAGHEVVGMAPDVDAAVKVAATLHVDLALVDYGLADGSCGADAAQLLRERYSTPSVFVSGDPGSCRKAWKRAGALGCLQKPFTDIDLLRAVEIAADLSAGKEPRATYHRFEIYSTAG